MQKLKIMQKGIERRPLTDFTAGCVNNSTIVTTVDHFLVLVLLV
jgi:hypothetical protein